MILKHYLTIAITIIIGTTCSAIIAMHLAMTSYERQEYHSIIEDEKNYFSESKFTEEALEARKTEYHNSDSNRKIIYSELMDYFQNPAPTEILNVVERDASQKIVQSGQSKYPNTALVSPGITKKSQKVVDDSKQTYTFNIRRREVEITRDNRNPSSKIKWHHHRIKNQIPAHVVYTANF
jgi:hypothetical protein